MKQLIDFFQDKQIKRLLDVGTGSGDFLLVLKQAFPGAEIRIAHVVGLIEQRCASQS